MYDNQKHFSFDNYDLSIVLKLVISLFSLLAICGNWQDINHLSSEFTRRNAELRGTLVWYKMSTC